MRLVHRRPDIDQLVACARMIALAMGQEAARDEDAGAFLYELLYKRRDEGGKEAWDGIEDGLITEVEVRKIGRAHV